MRDGISAWIAGNRRQVALTEQLAGAFETQDEQAIARVSGEIDTLDGANNATARRLGLRVCAQRVED